MVNGNSRLGRTGGGLCLREDAAARVVSKLSPFTIHHSPFTDLSPSPSPSLTMPPVPPAGTPIMTVVVRGGTGPRHGANVARCRGRRTDRQGAGFHVRRGCGNANPAGNSGPGKGNALGRFRIAMAGAFGRRPCDPATGRIPGGPPETPDGRPQGRTVCLDERPNGRPSSRPLGRSSLTMARRLECRAWRGRSVSEGWPRSPPLRGRCRRSRQRGVFMPRDASGWITPLCPAGHLLLKGGDWLHRRPTLVAGPPAVVIGCAGWRDATRPAAG